MRPKAEVMKDLARTRRRKIVIQQRETSKNEYGDVAVRWVDWHTVWAERNNLWGADYYAAAAIGEESTVEFTIRHVALLDQLNAADHRLVHDGVVYNVKQIDYLKDDGMWIKIRALALG